MGKNGIATPHRLWSERASQWRKIEDALAGEDAMKAHDVKEQVDNRDRYIPVLPGHDRRAKTSSGKVIDEYVDLYLRYAVFYGQPSIVLDGMLGLVFRQAPSWGGVDPIDGDLSNITLEGDDRDSFASDVLAETIKSGWGGVLVDWSTADGRAYQRLYDAHAVVNWRWRTVDGVPVLHQVILRETVEEPDADGFGTIDVEQYRRLELMPINAILEAFGEAGAMPPDSVTDATRLDPAGDYGSGIYVQQIYRLLESESGEDRWAPAGPPIVPDRTGSPLWFIPFAPLDAQPGTPPLAGITNMALAHYRNSADLENGIHKAGVPTLGLFGFRADGDDIRVGTLVRSTSADAHAEYIQTGGQGCAEVKAAMADKQRAIAQMASRMLADDQPKGAEQPEAHELRLVGSDARLRRLANKSSSALTLSTVFHLWWQTGATLEEAMARVAVRLNTKFFERRMSPSDLQTLWLLHLDGGISRGLYEQAKHSGGYARDGYSPGQEREEADAETATRPQPTAPLFDDSADPV